MIEEQELAARRAVRVFAEINHFMDNVLIATMQGHEAGAAARGPAAALPAVDGTPALTMLPGRR